jgi:Sulfotransferase family
MSEPTATEDADVTGGPDNGFPDPIFVLASPRSFSSLITAMIGQHPELYGMPELNLFQCETVADFNSGMSASGGVKSPFWGVMRHGLLRAIAQIHAGEQTPESIRMAERWLKLREDWTSAEVMIDLFAAVAPRRVIEKSPAILRDRAFLDHIIEVFPHARIIHLVRHPVPQGKSALAAKGGAAVLMTLNSVDYRDPEEAVLDPQISWHDAQMQILSFLDTLPDEQFVTIRGEDFLNDLDGHLPALCDWLGISSAPEALAAMRRPEDSPYSCVGPANARLGNDPNFLNSPALREVHFAVPALDAPLPWRTDGQILHPRVQELARALGYGETP